jgi:Alginate export
MRRTVFGVVLLALTVVARAQDYGSGGIYSIDRSSEDYSYLKNPANRTDFFDPIKYMPFSDNPDWYLSLGGQVRDRFDYFNNSNFGAGPRDNGFNLLRMLVNADVHFGPNFRTFVQLDSSMEFGRAGGPRVGDADAFDFQQAFVDVALPFDNASSAVVRLGRQELIYGAQRLISPNDWRNVRQSFDGGKVSFYLPNDTLDLFLVRPVIVNENHLNGDDDSTYLGGVYNVTELPQVIHGAHSKLDLYLLSLNKSISSTNTADSQTYTIGTRFHTNPGPWDFDVEPDWQFGKYSGTGISAYAVAAEAGYTMAEVPTTPRAAVGIDLASGSANPAHRFNQLFPPYYLHLGHMYLFGRQNIIDLHPGLTFTLTKDVTLTAEQHFFWRQNTNDAVYNLSGAVVRASDGSNKAFIGDEFDLAANWQIQRHISTYAGYAHFFAGPFIQATSAHNNEDEDFVYAAVTFTF